jgi:hypothetical protein
MWKNTTILQWYLYMCYSDKVMTIIIVVVVLTGRNYK